MCGPRGGVEQLLEAWAVRGAWHIWAAHANWPCDQGSAEEMLFRFQFSAVALGISPPVCFLFCGRK